MNINTTPTKVTERRVRSLSEVSEQLGASRNFVYSEIQRGKLKARKMGRRVVILTEDFTDYVNSLESR
jgi:excisionase family DNA binding protein